MFLFLSSAAALLVGTMLGYFITRRYWLRSSKDHLCNLARITGDLAGSAEQVAGVSRELCVAAEEQIEALSKTSSASVEIQTMIERTSENVKSLRNTFLELQLVAKRGSEVVQTMVGTSEQIKVSAQKFSEDMHGSIQELEAAMGVIRQVAKKTEVINEIVFQTKLLSFNASVEAARAGEAGKGFAVVAEEVGKLAKMSGDAATEISQIVEKGLSAVQSAVDTTKSRVESLSRETQERSTSGYLTAKDCEKMFAGLSTFVESSNRMVEQISLATEEQSQGVRLLDKAFRDLQEIAERNRLVGQQAIAHTSEFDKEIKSLSVSVDGLFVDWSLEKSTKRFSSFVWSDDLAFGLPHMDDEHKGIFLRMNSLISALERKDTTQLKSLYDDLSSFVVEHFRHEEEFMRSVHYPQLESHQKIHKNLLERVGQFGKDIEQGTLDERKLVSFLRNWLISHIMGVDRQYAQHAKGVHSKRAA